MTNPTKLNNSTRLGSGLLPSHWPWLLTVGFIIAVWLISIGLMASRYQSFSSPDESANALMARQYAATNQFKISTPLSAEQLGTFRPRSLATQGSDLLPGSFIGFVQIQGGLLKLGDYTPLVALLVLFGLALIAWYRIVRRYWEWQWSLVAVLVVATMPAILIYQALPWYHAAWFTSLLVLAGWALLRFQEQQTWGRAMVVGLFYGLALMIRPVEVLFTGPIVAVVMLVHHGRRKYFIGTLLTTLVIQIPWLITAWRLFGSWLASGYTREGVTLNPVATSGGASWLNIITPPGGQWSWHFMSASWETLGLLLPAVSVMAGMAMIIYFRRKFTTLAKILKIGLVILFVGCYLVYYGTLDIYPNTPANVGVLTSYVRYWLPLWFAFSAGVIVFLRYITQRRLKLAWPLLLVLLGVNGWTLWGHWSAGLLAHTDDDQEFVVVRSAVLANCPVDSLILAGRFDKVLSGYRWTSFNEPQSPADWQVLKTIIAQRPVYLLGAASSMNNKELIAATEQYQINLTNVTTVDDGPMWHLTLNEPAQP